MKLTPRSHEALLRSGFGGDDLKKKSVDEINKKYGNIPANETLLEKRLKHEEEKRQQRISTLAELREHIVVEEQKGLWSPELGVNKI